MYTTFGEGDIELSRAVCTLKTKLMWYLLGGIAVALVISVGCGYLLVQGGTYAIEKIYNNEQTNRTFQQRYMENLQSYVTNQQIKVENITQLQGWVESNPYVYISIYQNNRVIFNSDDMYPDEDGKNQIDSVPLVDTYTSNELIDSDKMYTLALTDGSTASVDMFCYDYWKYNNYIWVVSICLCICLFICILANLLKVKFSYIDQIENELQILEGGNMEYPITIKGEDELGNLARGIEQMRLSVIENMQKEKMMLQANKDLVTSMSHDLRTPLTTLTGYLELLSMDRVTEPEQRRRYLELSLAKTKEIKELSDELFEYFLIYGENRNRIDVEPVPAYELVMDLVENQFLSLEEQGFQVIAHNHVDENTGNCLIHVKYMQRVLNNILSNLCKYADVAKPIEIIANREQGYVVIRIRNGIRENLDEHESTNIGLITCNRIMKLQHGKFQTYAVEGEFIAKLVIPLEPAAKAL